MARTLETIKHIRWVWMAAGLALGLVLASSLFTAQAQTASTTTTEAMTVYVDGHDAGKLTNGVNASFKQYAPAGWAPVSVAVHSENNDTKGIWITYVRTIGH
jgi:hypothetical protein